MIIRGRCLSGLQVSGYSVTSIRTNHVQQEFAETHKTSQPTISRANSRITSRLAIVLAPFVPTAKDLDPDTQYIYDGTLLPCWSWRGHRELYSGKRKTTGKNVQVACNLYGELEWISDPVDGSRHDAHCIDESSVLVGFPEGSQMGDKGYVGKGMITPIRKPECRDLLDWEKEFSTQVNKIRYMIEQVIANFKTWRIMHTDSVARSRPSTPPSQPLLGCTSTGWHKYVTMLPPQTPCKLPFRCYFSN